MGKTTKTAAPAVTSNVSLLSIAYAYREFEGKKLLELTPTMHNEKWDFVWSPRYYGVIKAGNDLSFAIAKLQWKLEANLVKADVGYNFFHLKKTIESLVESGKITSEIE